MPQYWILSISEDNYLISKERSLIGVTNHGKRVIYQMATGDIITFYITRKRVDSPSGDRRQQVRKVRGVAQVTGEAFESNDVIWNTRGSKPFPHRRQVKFLSDAMADAQPLLSRLSYVANTMHWGLALRKGYVEIAAKDFDRIQTALGTQF